MKKIFSVLLSVLLIFSSFMIASASEENSKPFENSGFFVSDDYTLHYRVFEPEGEILNQVFLIHGFGLSTASLEGIAYEYVKKGCKVVLADMPNFGYSSRENKNSSLKSREELSYELMMSLSEDKWIVGGHSMGGGIAINIATDHPEGIKGLILFAPQTSSQMTSPMDKLMRSGLMQSVYNLLISFASKSDFLIRMMVEMSFSDKEYACKYDLSRVKDPLKIKNTGAGIAVMASHARATDFEKFSLLNIPTVIVTSKNDKIANEDNLDKIINNAPKETKVYTADFGGHMMMEYDAQRAAAFTMSVIG